MDQACQYNRSFRYGSSQARTLRSASGQLSRGRPIPGFFFSLIGVGRPGLRWFYGFHLDRSEVRIQEGFDRQGVRLIQRPPAKREGAADQLPMPSNAYIVSDLILGAPLPPSRPPPTGWSSPAPNRAPASWWSDTTCSVRATESDRSLRPPAAGVAPVHRDPRRLPTPTTPPHAHPGIPV